jgi:peptidoglycan hydrolase CwlO-like protein
MTDIVTRIEAHLQNDDAAKRHWECDNLLEEAQARIVELDGFICTINEQTTALEEENERLNKALRWEQHRAGRVGTHSPGCWTWGPQHYQCAIQHIAALDKEIESAALIVAEVRKEMADARTEIREMNRRIDMLRGRKS